MMKHRGALLTIVFTFLVSAVLIYAVKTSKISPTATSVSSANQQSTNPQSGEKADGVNTEATAPRTQIESPASVSASTTATGKPEPSAHSVQNNKTPEQLRRESEELARIAEQLKLKEKGAAQAKQVFDQMRKDEIASLKNSIQNDLTLLKKIEESGSGIEDYKYIEQNLKIRRARLKELTEK